jgi:hypothetical protein
MKIVAFERFSGIKKLKVQGVTDKGQVSMELTKDKYVIRVK